MSGFYVRMMVSMNQIIAAQMGLFHSLKNLSPERPKHAGWSPWRSFKNRSDEAINAELELTGAWRKQKDEAPTNLRVLCLSSVGKDGHD